MRRITAYIRTHQIEGVKSAVAALNVSGISLTDVRGQGNSRREEGASPSAFRPLPARTRVEVIVQDEVVEEVVQAILEHAFTGKPDDGKIFIEPIADVIRIRTGERGTSAV